VSHFLIIYESFVDSFVSLHNKLCLNWIHSTWEETLQT